MQPRPRARFVRAALAALALATCLVAGALAQQSTDPAKGLKSKVVAERLAAVEALRTSTDPTGEKLLQGALSDRDWEVVEKAAAALAERGSEASSALLVRLSIDGPIARIRRTAARTLAKIAAEKATGELAKLCSGKSAQRAFEALAIVGAGGADGAVATGVQKGLKAKDRATHLAAVRCIPWLPQAVADDALAELLKGGDPELACAALEAVAAAGQPHFLTPLFAALRAPKVPDVVERRLIAAAAGSLGGLLALGRPEVALEQVSAFLAQGGPPVGEAEARFARLCGALAKLAPADSPIAAALEAPLSGALAHKDPRMRKAALAAGLRAGLTNFQRGVVPLAAGDADASVRGLALRELAAARGAKDAAVLELLLGRATGDADPRVREIAVVLLGAPEPGAVDALARATTDADWAVVTCAAVSLGKTQDPAARAPLEALLAKDDWRHRASAVTGLCLLYQKEAVPALIRALGDADPSVKRTAYLFLEHQLKAKLAENRAAWEEWWKANGERARLIDPAVAKARAERYGYAVDTAAAFEELDVVVLQSRGDHIEELLERLKIAHRLTQASKVDEAALSPGAIYVSNCTGEIEPKDAARLAWYVRAGGVLFGSCWSLEKTIEPVHPGVLRKKEIQGDVLDDVIACAVDRANPYLKGVFAQDAEPLYHLEGAHLIEVLEPEFCEVLIDSPQAQKRWDCGNLAAAFRSGHGLILDSANHFELQGLEVAPGLKTSDDRIAFAFDRMGMEYATWRATQDEKWWDSALKASQNVFDESALKFVTNFVRAKRLADG